jgi:hypothetical protein
LVSSLGSGLQEGGGRDDVAKVMISHAMPAIQSEIKAGPHIGSITSLQKTEKAKFSKFSPKPPVFTKLLKTNNLIAPNGTP